MKAKEYLEYLKQATRSSDEISAQRIEAVRYWARLRYEQTGDPTFLDLAENYYDFWPDAQDRTIKEDVFSPFVNTLEPDIRSKIIDIPIGTLPLRVVNAHTLRAPAGDPLIVVDVGLMTMIHYYMEAQTSFHVIQREQGLNAAVAYLWGVYKFIIQYFAQEGQLSFPEELVKMSGDHFLGAMANTLAAETFAVGHEIAHAYAGHLENAATKECNLRSGKGVSAEFYQLLREQEFEADSIAWKWYQQAWKSIDILKIMKPERALMSPLLLFVIMSLVEKNLAVPDQYSAHPSAQDRLSRLIESISSETSDQVQNWCRIVLELV